MLPPLIGHPEFGDSALIRERFLDRLTVQTDVVERVLGRMVSDRSFVDRCLGDPVVRSTGRSGVDQTELLVEAARAAKRGPLTAVANELGTDEPLCLGTHLTWLFRPTPGVLNQRLQSLISAYVNALPCPGRLVGGTDEVRQALTRAADLLVALVPELAADALTWVRVVAVIETGLTVHSATLDGLPGVVLVDPAGLGDPLVGAELLLHEALHAKFDAVMCTRPIFATTQRDRVLVTAVWHNAGLDGKANLWSLTRTVSAFHVYAHLVAFGAALAVAPATANHGRNLYDRALFRALYLGRELLRYGQHLSSDGEAFVRWLLGTLPPIRTLSPEQCYLIEHGHPSRLRARGEL